MSPPVPIDTEPGHLRRDLTLIDAVGFGLGAIIGAGIFVVSGVAAGVAGARPTATEKLRAFLGCEEFRVKLPYHI